MSNRVRNVAAVAVATIAVVIAVLAWPSAPIELGDTWLHDAECASAPDGVRFTAHVRAPSGVEAAELSLELQRISVDVVAHEGGRMVAESDTTVSLETTERTSTLVSSAATSPPLAIVDLLLPAGAVKSPTCTATVMGHR